MHVLLTSFFNFKISVVILFYHTKWSLFFMVLRAIYVDDNV